MKPIGKGNQKEKFSDVFLESIEQTVEVFLAVLEAVFHLDDDLLFGVPAELVAAVDHVLDVALLWQGRWYEEKEQEGTHPKWFVILELIEYITKVYLNRYPNVLQFMNHGNKIFINMH